mmetsp:Transcript_20423/g.19405  ORF Transcript_20423/g.19405 Transcript_20423/m.19405 type:complete len:224 (-) Transcript_20423:271-942(-)
MRKLLFGSIRLTLSVFGSKEHNGDAQHGHDDDGLVDALELLRGHDHPRQKRVQRELRHLRPQLRQIAIVGERLEVVKLFEGPHEGLWGRRVHVVEVDHVLDVHLHQVQHHRRQIRPQNLWVGVLYQILLISLLRVQSETFAGTSPTGPTCPLLRTGLTDRTHQQRLHPQPRIVHLLLGEAWVDDVDDAVDGEGGLCDVGGDHTLPPQHPPPVLPWRRLKDLGL